MKKTVRVLTALLAAAVIILSALTSCGTLQEDTHSQSGKKGAGQTSLRTRRRQSPR